MTELKIRCPFCGKEFSPENTVFRAYTSFSAEETQIGSEDEQNLRRLFREYDDYDGHSKDIVDDGGKYDIPLVSFWEDRGGQNGYSSDDIDWAKPHIRIDDKAFERMLTSAGNSIKRYSDGFPYAVVDAYQKDSTARLCPHCHNALPLSVYGKNDVKHIALVGITASGKTVFLDRLLSDFSNVLIGTGYSKGETSFGAGGGKVRRGRELPHATDSTTMRRPLAIQMEIEDSARRNVRFHCENHVRGDETVVFYDIAGENCIIDENNANATRLVKDVTDFIGRCDGLIFLIDPDQIPDFSGRDTSEVSDVVNAIQAISRPDSKAWSDIPVAIVLNKIDIPECRVTLEKKIPSLYEAVSSSNGFNLEACKIIDRSMRSFFDESAPSIESSLSAFSNRAYFGASSLISGTELRLKKYGNQYRLDETNARKFNSLHRWIAGEPGNVGWNQRSKDERLHYRKCPVVGQDGSEILFDSNQPITEANSKGLLTEIKAEVISGGDDDIYLSVWDTLNLTCSTYPLGTAMSLNIGESVKWLLWRLGVIGPYYDYRSDEEEDSGDFQIKVFGKLRKLAGLFADEQQKEEEREEQEMLERESENRFYNLQEI